CAVLACFCCVAAASPGVDTPSLHDALPIWGVPGRGRLHRPPGLVAHPGRAVLPRPALIAVRSPPPGRPPPDETVAHGCEPVGHRSEEHTSELQSRENLVCRLLLEKKKHTTT